VTLKSFVVKISLVMISRFVSFVNLFQPFFLKKKKKHGLPFAKPAVLPPSSKVLSAGDIYIFQKFLVC
jgi:hypothetical protein